MNNTIFDIGMHNGTDTEFYLKKGFNVVAVEANPALLEVCHEKFGEYIKSGQLVIIGKAIAGHEGDVSFYVFPNKDDWGGLHESWNTSMIPDNEKITVPSMTFDSILEEYGIPYYLKIDIEGSDILCLKALAKYEAKPKYVSVEFLTPNNLSGEKVDALDLLCHLKALGYTKFLVSDQSKVSSSKCPNPSLEGESVDYDFGSFGSGVFGKDLEGTWMGLDELAMHYLDYFYEGIESEFFHNDGWFDIHATT